MFFLLLLALLSGPVGATGRYHSCDGDLIRAQHISEVKKLGPNLEEAIRNIGLRADPEERARLMGLLYRTKIYKNVDVAQATLNDLRLKSAWKKEVLRESPTSSIRTFDYIFGGMGIHSAIVKSAMGMPRMAEFNKLKVMTLEATNHVSVMGRIGKAFRGNTREHPEVANAPWPLPYSEMLDQSKNFMPGAPIQVTDVASGVVPIAYEFQMPAVSSHWLSGGDTLFESPIENYWKIRDGPQKGMVAVQIKGGEIFFTKNLILATGLGKEKLPTKDPRSLEFLASEKGKKHVLFVEKLLEEIQNEVEDGRNYSEKFGGSRVILLGGGHGSAIAFEALEGIGPEALLQNILNRNEAFTAPKAYLWASLKASSGEEFKKIIGGGDRYYPIAPWFDTGKIKTNDYYVYEILEGKGAPVRVSFMDKETGKPILGLDGKIEYIEANWVINATGYEGINLGLARGFGEGAHFDPIQGEILPNDARIYHDEAVTIGTRLISEDGTAESIFTAGPSSGLIGHEKDPGGKKSVTINSFAARSQALGLWLRSEYFKNRAYEKR